jgi:hypothetical protein
MIAVGEVEALATVVTETSEGPARTVDFPAAVIRAIPDRAHVPDGDNTAT